jgi:hypothetical protein
MPNGIGNPISTIRYAEESEVNATTEPTLSSIPPVRITIVSPTAIIAKIEDCTRMLEIFFPLRKYGLNKENRMKINRNPM